MSSRVVAAIAAAFAAGVFVAAAPTVLGHGPGADQGRGSMHADSWADRADHMADGCEQEEMLEHMAAAGSHMSGGHMSGGGDWMTDMMSSAGAPR